MSAVEAILIELRAIRRLLEDSGRRSSVDIDSNTRAGTVKLRVHEYAGSEPPVADAIANFKAAWQQLEAEQMAGWEATVESLNRRDG